MTRVESSRPRSFAGRSYSPQLASGSIYGLCQLLSLGFPAAPLAFGALVEFFTLTLDCGHGGFMDLLTFFQSALSFINRLPSFNTLYL